jgi:hypothetical protein
MVRRVVLSVLLLLVLFLSTWQPAVPGGHPLAVGNLLSRAGVASGLLTEVR